MTTDIGRPVPITVSGCEVHTHCVMCGLSYELHDHDPDNWLDCPRDLCERLKGITWLVQGNSNAPDNLLEWLVAGNRYPQHRGREAALKLIADLWWKAGRRP